MTTCWRSLRNWTIRSGEYLDLVRFYLNHHRFPRSDRPDRVGRSPHELLTGQPQLHWLDQLTNSPSHAA